MHRENDLVTIIVAHWESEKLLVQTLDCIARQEINMKNVLVVTTLQNTSVTGDWSQQVHFHFCTTIQEGYNSAVKEIKTPFVMFMHEGDILGPKYVESCVNVLMGKKEQRIEHKKLNVQLDSHILYSFCPKIINAEDVNIVVPSSICISPLLSGKTPKHRFSKDYVKGIYAVDLNENYFALQTMFRGCLIRSNFLSNYQFNERITFEYETDVLLRMLIDHPIYLTNDLAEYFYYEPLENDALFHLPPHYPEWYFPSIDNYILPLLEYARKENELPAFIQNYIVYYVKCRLMSNLDNRNKKQILGEQVECYRQKLKLILKDVDDYYLLNQDRLIYLPKNPEVLCLLLRIKYDEKDIHYDYVDTFDEEGNQDLQMQFRGNIISSLNNHRFTINVMNYFDGELTLDGSLISIFKYCDLQYYADFEGNSTLVENTDAYSLTKYFGIPCYRRITYYLHFPLKDKNIQKLSFYASFNGKKYPLKISFGNHWAKLSKSPRYSYWRFNKYLCHHANNMIVIKHATFTNTLKREIQFQLNLIFKHSYKGLRALGMRWIYWITRPYFKKKKIWLMLDKLYKGGDSCEYLYRYSAKFDDGVTKYYLINENTKEYKELKKEGYKPLKNGSLMHKLVFLNADLLLITNSHLFPFNGYTKATSKYIRGLCNFTSMCLQHGLTVQKCAMAQRRIIDNTTGYFLASKLEYENLMHHAYGYKGFDYLHLTGIARYDGLKNNDKKQILLSPTWRMYNALPVTTSEGEQRGYNPDFKNTTYFHIYNNLINNERLLDCAKETGYKIKYLLHPILSSQANDFTSNSEVEVIPSVGDLSYEKILTESSLMVTDYSGVQFDFAYMRKPIVYFHPEELPPHYDDGLFLYDTMGFGEICTKSEQLVDLLCEYMKNECKMKQEYVNRADNFFMFSDHNNCERIYHKVMEYQKQIDIDKLRSE